MRKGELMICKSCKKERPNEGHQLCINCVNVFKYHRKKYKVNLNQYLEYQHFMRKYKSNIG